jgi:hypothetical protein
MLNAFSPSSDAVVASSAGASNFLTPAMHRALRAAGSDFVHRPDDWLFLVDLDLLSRARLSPI